MGLEAHGRVTGAGHVRHVSSCIKSSQTTTYVTPFNNYVNKVSTTEPSSEVASRLKKTKC